MSVSWGGALAQQFAYQFNARILARLIPHATLHIFNGGHLFALSEKEQVASLVHAFLRND